MRTTRLALALAFVSLLLGFPAAAAEAEGPAPQLTVTPGFFAFGPINVGGELGEPAEFTLSNQGTADVQLETASVTGTDPFSFIIIPQASSCYLSDGLLSTGESCTIVVIFDPVNEGPNSANLEIVSDSATSPDLLPLTGTGLETLVPGASLGPQEVDFGSQKPGSSPDPVTITLTSTGNGDLTIGSPLVIGPDADQFSVTTNNCSNRSMAPGDSCELSVVFDPAGSGPRSTEVTLPTDAEGADTTVTVTGTAEAAPTSRHSRVSVGSRLRPLDDSGSQAIGLRCHTTGMFICQGTVTLKVPGPALGQGPGRMVTIGSLDYQMKPGSHLLNVRLSERAVRRLRSEDRLRVRIITTSRQGDGGFRRYFTYRQLRL